MCLPFYELVLDLIESSDVGREESFRTVEDVHQNGELSFFQMTPFIIDVRHDILESERVVVAVKRELE